MKTFCILLFFWAVTDALYPPADYDSIVASSIDVRHGENTKIDDDCLTEKTHVIGRPAIEHFLAKLKPEHKEEKPKKPALLIRRPVIITSLSGKPVEIIETKNVEKVHESPKPSGVEKIETNEGPTKLSIDLDKYAPAAPLYGHGPYPLQDCEYPELYGNSFSSQFGYGYPIYSPTVHVSAVTYGQPAIVSTQKFDEKKEETAKPVLENSISYAAPWTYNYVPYSPVYQVPTVGYGAWDKEPEQISHPEQFGYDFNVYSSPTYQTPVVPALEYGPPKVSVSESSFDEKKEDRPVVPATEYGPPKTTDPIFSVPSETNYPSVFSPVQQLPLNEKYKPFSVHQYRLPA